MPSVITYPGVFDGVYSPIVFSRASSGTYFNSAGVLTTAAANAPRIDYTPGTLVKRGMLIEEARTNSVSNNTMVGAVAGTPGTAPTGWIVTSSGNGITRTIVGTGVENGISYIDIQYTTGAGTTTAAGSMTSVPTSTTAVEASQGQTWVGSTYVKLVGGSTAGWTSFSVAVTERDNVGTSLGLSASTSFTPTSAGLATQRIQSFRTLTSASVVYVTGGQINLNYPINASLNMTLRIGLPQLEQGAFATSVIPTTTAAAARSADVASVNTLSPWYNATEGTLYAEVSAAGGFNVTGNFGRFAGIQDAISSNNTEMFFDGTSNQAPRYRVRIGGVNQAIGNSATAYTANTVLKAGLAYAVNDFSGVSRGVVDLTDTSGVVPVGVTFLSLGSEGGGSNFLNGYLRRVAYYPTRLTNAQLQALTA